MSRAISSNSEVDVWWIRPVLNNNPPNKGPNSGSPIEAGIVFVSTSTPLGIAVNRAQGDGRKPC